MLPRIIACLAAPTSAAALPDILYVLLDDYGWADAGWHRPVNYTDVQTPHMDALVREGVELDRHYAFKYCSPTRSAIQSGRNPIYVNVLNIPYQIHNPKDLVSGFPEIPRNMTGLAEHLVQAGYETHMYGKWHAGMATPQQTPQGRGYQKSLCYLGGWNDYWTSAGSPCLDLSPHKLLDLWENDHPAPELTNPASCSQEHQEGCVYEDKLFLNRVEAAISDRNRSKPMFIFWAPHIVHVPLQVPQDTLGKFSSIDEPHRRLYHAMVYWIDEAIGNVTQMLKQAGTWNNTLVIVHADNGGPIYDSGTSGGNNYPLKGGKRSNWEGGIRVNAFVTGGLLPENVRGTKQTGLMAAWDWFATITGLAGVKDITDYRAAAAGLPPVDSLDMWPLISGQASDSPRTELAIGDTTATSPHIVSDTRVGGLIQGRYKLIVGRLESSGWCGPTFPNSSSSWNPSATWQTCGRTIETGCLYDIFSDPGEHINLAEKEGKVFRQMLARMDELQKDIFSPDRGTLDGIACKVGLQHYGGFWGPFVDIDKRSTSEELVV
mmetsp:Transcript_61207/g.108908  ORF Transcript_61207/g.108908 Transcript_61207/m.108908 type:complete len:546 (+) Transcript_61207:157-1794(+)